MLFGEDQFKTRFSRIYPFTTENIDGYIDFFDLKDKSLLTVGSSGDQAINAALKGCKDITVVDVNPLSKYYYYLKVASILSLKIEEFYKFLNYMEGLVKRNNKAFNKETYLKIRQILKALDEESFDYWERKFDTRKPLNVRKNLFMRDEYSRPIIAKCNPYLHGERVYEETRAILSTTRPKFITSNLIYDDIPGEYDNIWLSNIPAFIDLKTLRLLVNKMNLILKKEGTLLISYLYIFDEFTNFVKGWDPIYNIDEVERILPQYKLELRSFNGTEFRDERDSVLMYHK